nr:hypothetical protein [Tanacetum cinerariifolium]
MSQQNTHPFGDDNANMIIPGRAGILQLAQLRKTSEIKEGGHNGEMLTQEYVRKITEEASEDDHFTRGPWLSAIQYLVAEGGIATGCFGDIKTFIKNGKLEKVVAVIKSCTPNMLGDLTVMLKDLSGMMSSTIHYKVLNEEVYGNAISVGAVLILCNVLVFSPKYSGHYLNITLKNIVKVFHKDTSVVNSEDINLFTEWNLLANIPGSDTNHDHILGLLHKCYQPMDDAAETSLPDRKLLISALRSEGKIVLVVASSENMRLQQPGMNDNQKKLASNFATWLLDVGNGKIRTPESDNSLSISWVTIPKQYCIPYTKNAMENLINFIYDNKTLRNPNACYLQHKAIVYPKNSTLDITNSKILSAVKGTSTIFKSSDEAIPVGNDGGGVELLYPT